MTRQTSAPTKHMGAKYQKYLMESMAEADTLKNLTCEQRLDKCIFKYEGPAATSEFTPEASKELSFQAKPDMKKHHGRDTKTGICLYFHEIYELATT